MNQTIEQLTISEVAQRLGLAIKSDPNPSESGTFDFSPAEAHQNEAFFIRFIPGWRSVEVVFVPGKFAGLLMGQMGMTGPEGRAAFVTFVKALEGRRAKITMRVNGNEVSAVDSLSWPGEWQRLDLSIRSAPLVVNTEDMAQMHQLVIGLVIPLFGMVVALIGVEEARSVAGEAEGQAVQSLVTRYERKLVNREACIQLKGTRCLACGFDFEAAYGPIGANYIEVHHTTMVSQLGAGYRINVETDLEPLCANCHAMVHRENPPISIQRLQEIIAQRPESKAT